MELDGYGSRGDLAAVVVIRGSSKFPGRTTGTRNMMYLNVFEAVLKHKCIQQYVPSLKLTVRP